MDIYITDLETGGRLRFPALPEEILVKAGAVFKSYDILSAGEIKIPSGEKLTGFSWQGFLPGASRKGLPYIKAWKSPAEIQSIWSIYRNKGKKLNLLITETPINHNVYLEAYDVSYKNGLGDFFYKISFITAKDIKIYAEKENPVQIARQRAEPPVPNTYTVKDGDTLWSIAQKYLGSGARYPEIHAINKPPLGSDPGLIYTGQVIRLP